MDVWPSPTAPNFCDHVWGGHLEEQMQGIALLANAKAAIKRQANEFQLERMYTLGKVNNLVYWAEASLCYTIVCPSGTCEVSSSVYFQQMYQ